jgi:hypothetical protein
MGLFKKGEQASTQKVTAYENEFLLWTKNWKVDESW